MTIIEPAASDESIRFASLESLRFAHNQLLKRFRITGPAPEMISDVEDFIRRGKATGALLDKDSERWAAQSELDYWATQLYTPEYEPPDAALDEFNPELAPEIPDSLCPYVGLDSFHESKQTLFFGRNRLIDELSHELETSRFLAVLGSSGSGKSSLVRAGLVPALKRGCLPSSENWIYFSPIVPGSNPIANLARLLLPVDLAPESTEAIIVRLRREPDYLVRLVSERFNNAVVLVIDQFEEIFTLCTDEIARNSFVDNLISLCQDAKTQHRVIVTMRSDFEANVARIPKLQALFEENVVRITAFSASELREIIEEPAAMIGLKFEDGVVDALLNDILGEPAALPLLQFTLLKLWEHRERNRVTWETYKKLGGGRQTLARSADEFYNSLILEEQITMRRILLKMVRPGEGLEITSNRIPRKALYQKAEANDRIDRVLDKLIKERLVRFSEGDNASDEQIEIAHEALVRNWPRLVEWLEEDRVTLRQRQRLTTAAEEWQRLNHATSALWRRELLEEALHYDDLNDLETKFVQASKARQRRARMAWVSGITAIITLLLVAVIVFSIQASANAHLAQQNEVIARTAQAASTKAVAQQMLAIDNAQELAKQALADRLVSQARLMFETRSAKQTTAVLLAVRSMQLSPSVEASEILMNNTLASPILKLTHDGTVKSIVFSPNGRYIVSGSNDGTARVWDIATGKEISRITYKEWVHSVIFDPTGQYVVSAGCEQVDNEYDYNCTKSVIRIWQPMTGKEVASMVHPGEINTVTFSPNGQYVVTEGCDLFDENYDCTQGTARTWRTSTWEEIAHITQPRRIYSVTFSPDGQHFLADGCNQFDSKNNCIQGIVQVWETATGNEIAHMNHDGWVNSTAFSPSGQYIVSGSNDDTARVWETATGTEVARMTHYEGSVSSVVFSMDGKYVVSSGGTTARVWEALTGNEITSIVYFSSADYAVVRSDGKYIVSAGCDQRDKDSYCTKSTAHIWETTTWNEIARLDQEGYIDSIVFSSNNKFVALSGCNHVSDGNCIQGTSRVWQTTTWREVAHLIQDGEFRFVTFSPDGQHIVSASNDETVRVWKAVTQNETLLLDHDGYSIYSVAYSLDGKYIVSSGGDNTVRVWQASTGVEVFRITPHNQWIDTVAISSDSKYLVSVGCDQNDKEYNCIKGSASVREIITGNEIAKTTHNSYISAVVISPNGQYFVSGSCDQINQEGNCTQVMAREWETTTGKEIASMAQNGFINSIAVSPDSHYIASAACDEKDEKDNCVLGIIHVWEASTGNEIARMTHNNYVNSIAFSSDGKYIVSGSDDNTARVWEARTGKEISRMTHDNYVSIVTFSPDGQKVVSGSGDGTARLWEVSTGKEISRMTHDGYVNLVSFSPDGQYVVSGSGDRTARIWKASTGKEIARVTHFDRINSVAFSPDGKYVISGSDDGTIQVWNWKPSDLISDACTRLTRNMTSAEWKQFIGDEPYEVICPNLPIHPTVIAEKILPTLLDTTNIDRIQDAIMIANEMLRQNSMSGDINELANSLVKDTIQEQIVSSQDIKTSLTLHEDAKMIGLEIDNAYEFNYMCWDGSIAGYAKEVLQYCEQAVVLAPDDQDIRDSRGLARALTGDFEGAISDFQYFVDHSTIERLVAERMQWITELKKGNNPFTPDVLEHLKDE